MMDRLEWGVLKPEDITARALDGRGLVALFALKRDLMIHVVNFELDRIGMASATKAVFKEVVSSFTAYRTRLNPHPRPDPDGGPLKQHLPDLRWQAGWTGSAKEMLRFTENLVFGDTHDLCLKNAIRGGKRSPADAMQAPSVQSRMAEIMELRNAEKLKESSASGSGVGQPLVPVTKATGDASSAASVDTTTSAEDEAAVLAKRTFHSYVTRHVETESQHDLKLALNSSSLGNLFAVQNVSNVLVVFDVKQSAEPTAQPNIRISPVKEGRLKTLVIGVLEARGESAGKPFKHLLPGNLYLMPDGGRKRTGSATCSWTKMGRRGWRCPDSSMCAALRMA